MKAINHFAILIIFLGLSSCAGDMPSPNTSETPAIKNTIVETQEPKGEITLSIPAIALPNDIEERESLTLEESANAGIHNYSFRTEFVCPSHPVVETEKFSITFYTTSVELKRLEPADMQWVHQYKKSSLNTYIEYSHGINPGNTQVTLIFNKDGFIMMSSDGPKGCGNYFRNITP